MNKFIIRATVALSILGAGVAACSSDDKDDHDDGHSHDGFLDFCDLPKSCQDIVNACHTKDLGEEGSEIHECHETGHEVGTDEACSKVHDDCVKTCNDAPDLGGAGPGEIETCDDGGAG